MLTISCSWSSAQEGRGPGSTLKMGVVEVQLLRSRIPETSPASLATHTSCSHRVACLFNFVGVAQVSPYQARMAHQGKQLSRVVTVIPGAVVDFFSYVTVVEELQHLDIETSLWDGSRDTVAFIPAQPIVMF